MIGISFFPLLLLYGVFFDWTNSVERYRLAYRRLVRSPLLTVTPARVRHGPPGIAGVVVSLTLVTAVAAAGATQTLNGWPVASYPDFAYRIGDHQSTVALLVREDDTIRPMHLEGLGSIAQTCLLYRSLSDEQELTQLQTMVEADFPCSPNSDLAVWIEYTEFEITDAGPTRVGDPVHTLVHACPGT